MKHVLVEIISQMTEISKEEELAIIDTFPIKNFEKGSYLLKEGQVSKESYFIIKGCIREYILLDGEERTTAFYTENEPVANYISMLNKTASKINFVCSETTMVAITHVRKEKEFYIQFPRFKEFCLEGMEKMMGEQHEKLTEFTALKPEQKYLKLQEERPDLLNRIPQYQIASYLGVKPETLSRIRARLVEKN